jgi:hypothetical protein
MSLNNKGLEDAILNMSRLIEKKGKFQESLSNME